ncbi:hypothetical protein [Erwinia sp. PsM31]|uniref:hypothetical protein n=1 Tax=Erwinia sp. PsM31 TaxID=3030535 RepID=UPI00263B87FF|nr:hypothetical protein [Erwinia sp. PsM31]MDN4626289.1 hypothetical protein [Erwinia sp. PsM31]
MRCPAQQTPFQSGRIYRESAVCLLIIMISFGFLTHYVSYFARARRQGAIKQTIRTADVAKKLLNINICASVINNKLVPVNIKARVSGSAGNRFLCAGLSLPFSNGALVKKGKSQEAASLYP